MSYNQSFKPQPGEGNLSAQFAGPQYPPTRGGSAPQDIPGRTWRHSSVSNGYSSYPPPQASYGVTPPGGYAASPGMANSPQGSSYIVSPQQHMAAPPSQMPMYGTSPSSQPAAFGTSPQHLHPMAAAGPPPPGTGWQNPPYAPSNDPPTSYAPVSHRRSSTSSYKSHHSSSDSPDKKHKSKRKNSGPQRYDSPRRPTMTDSVLAAWGGLKGAFDKRE
jgi:hypothetical protein